MKNIIFVMFIISVSLFIYGCGEGVVEFNSESLYVEKIVIEGFIYPDKKVENIKITRNLPLSLNMDISTLILSNAIVTLTEISTGNSDVLDYDPQKFSFEDSDNNFQIKEGESYKLDVSANIVGKNLQASSVTKVPFKGLKAEQEFLGSMNYYDKDENGNVKYLRIDFTTSPQCEFYAVSIIPLNDTENDFIVDNIFTDGNHKDDYKEELDRYRKQFSWLQNVNVNAEKLSTPVEWFNIWFYGNYRAIIYATDKNYKDFLLTHRQVQEMDGNFHEPQMNIQGDGIGVFASAVTDTVYFEILR